MFQLMYTQYTSTKPRIQADRLASRYHCIRRTPFHRVAIAWPSIAALCRPSDVHIRLETFASPLLRRTQNDDSVEPCNHRRKWIIAVSACLTLIARQHHADPVNPRILILLLLLWRIMFVFIPLSDPSREVSSTTRAFICRSTNCANSQVVLYYGIGYGELRPFRYRISEYIATVSSTQLSSD